MPTFITHSLPCFNPFHFFCICFFVTHSVLLYFILSFSLPSFSSLSYFLRSSFNPPSSIYFCLCPFPSFVFFLYLDLSLFLLPLLHPFIFYLFLRCSFPSSFSISLFLHSLSYFFSRRQDKRKEGRFSCRSATVYCFRESCIQSLHSPASSTFQIAVKSRFTEIRNVLGMTRTEFMMSSTPQCRCTLLKWAEIWGRMGCICKISRNTDLDGCSYACRKEQ
jgi:hypothetical protein